MAKPSLFRNLVVAKPIEVVDMCQKFADDEHEDKENLSIGGYLDESGHTYCFKVVKEVEQKLLQGMKKLGFLLCFFRKFWVFACFYKGICGIFYLLKENKEH